MTQREELPAWSMLEIIAKAYAYKSVGDPHALDVKGAPRWKWFVEEAEKYIEVFGYELRRALVASPKREETAEPVAYRFSDGGGYNADWRYSTHDPREYDHIAEESGASCLGSVTPLYATPPITPAEAKEMHRRAQKAEGAVAAVQFVLDGWAKTLSDGQLPKHDWLMGEIKRELDKAIARAAPVQPVANADAHERGIAAVAHILTGYVGGTCCHKTGGKTGNASCECKDLARELIAAYQAALSAKETNDG